VALSVLLSLLHMSWFARCRQVGDASALFFALCYNTFPLQSLTEKNKSDLTRCAKDILLAREAHFPATIPIFMTLTICRLTCASS